jgi:hypothetical protein
MPAKLKTLESKIEKLTELVKLVIARSVVEVSDEDNKTVRAAAYLEVAPGTLAIWRMTPGRGPRFTYSGSTPVYSKADLDEWRDKQRANGKKRAVSDRVGRPPGSRNRQKAAR